MLCFLIFARNAADKRKHKFNRPEEPVSFHKEIIKFIMNDPIY